MFWTVWIGLGAVLAALAVGMGAFGAHVLKDKLSPEYLAVDETAVRYHMYHALGLLGIGLVATRIDNFLITVSGCTMLVGILLFSGSLYVLTLSGMRWLGMVTPFGGLAFILAWLTLAWTVLRASA